MTEKNSLMLLYVGGAFAKFLQWASVLAGGIVVLLIPVLALRSLGVLPGAGSATSVTDASPLVATVIFVMLAVMFFVLFRFFRNMRALIVSARTGDPFTPENSERLTAMAWLFLAAKLLALVVGLVRLHLANRVSGGGDSLDISIYDLDAVLIVLVLFTLAHVFRHGAAMREDLQGTV